jgi:hypothetical protein
MSNYRLTPKRPGLTIQIGWDRPLASLFYDVFNDKVDEDDPGYEVLTSHLGKPGQHLRDVQAAIAAVAPFAEIPDDLAARLHRDMHG